MASFGNPADSVRSPVASRTRLATGVPVSRRTCSSLHPASRPAGACARAHGSFEPKNGRLAETLEAFAPSRSIPSVARAPDSNSRRVAPWCRQRRPGVSAARANSPIDVSSDSFVLSAAETTNEPDTDAILDDALGGESIAPGLASTGYLVFDVAPKAATAIATDANLVVFDPADEGAPQDPDKRVGFIRRYTRPDAGRFGASESSGAGVAPDAGVDQTAAAEDGSYSYQEAIRSPSGRIKCAISRGPDGHRVECTMDEAPTASGETNWLRLDDTGPATRFAALCSKGTRTRCRTARRMTSTAAPRSSKATTTDHRQARRDRSRRRARPLGRGCAGRAWRGFA
jgi:hypothetical protein